MRLDNDLRFLPFAGLIWLIILGNHFLTYNKVLIWVLLLFIILIIFIRNKLFLISYLLFAVLILTTIYYRLSDFNSQDYNFTLEKQVEIIGQIRSDLIPSSSPKFGTLDMFTKYYFKFKVEHLEQNKIIIKEISGPIKVNTSSEKNLMYGSRIKIIGQLEKSTFVNFKYEITPEKIILLNHPGQFNRFINSIRNNFILSTQKLNTEGSELLPGLILGDTRFQSKVLKEDMKLSGLTHLTAVSGGNIAILIIALSFLIRRMKLHLRIEIFLIFLFLLFFTFLVRAEPSVIRASLMASIVLVSILYGVLKQGVNALLITICVALLLDPNLAISWGFTLSVFATFGLLLLTEPILDYLIRNFPWLNQNLLLIMSVALAAQFSTLGLVVGFTGLISIWSVIANTLVSPVVPIVTILGYLALVVSNLNSSFAIIFNFPAAVFANWIVVISHYFANKEFSTIKISNGIIGFVIANLFLLFIVFLLKKFKIIFILTLILTLISIFSVKYIFFNTKWPLKNWQFVMCDVGQGDGLIIKDSTNKTIVVDVGPDGKLMTKCLKQLGIKHIDILLLTHFHLDHVEGLKEVMKNHQIKTVFASWIMEPPEEAMRVKQLLYPKKIDYLVSGQKVRLGEIKLTCLWPTTKKMEIESIANNSSLVVMAEIENASILLTGDVEPPAQEDIRRNWQTIQVDVIKIPHHGSKYQDDLFPKWSRARLALVSAGADNSYGHPAKATIELYEQSKMSVLSSNVYGSVSIFINEHDQIVYSSTG